MAAFGSWADLATEILLSIADGFSLKEYVLLRSVCTAWRSALAIALVPPFPSFLVLTDGHRDPASSLLTQRLVHLSTDSLDSRNRVAGPSTPRRRNRIAGSSNGCLAVASDLMGGSSTWTMGIVLLNPHTGQETKLLPPRNARYLRKVVFAPNPSPDVCTVVAICDLNEVAYTRTCRETEWTIINVAMKQLADLAYDVEGGKVYCLDGCGDVRVLHLPRDRMQKPTVEFLLAGRAGLRFDPAAAFAPPHHIASRLTSAKNLFLRDGSLYQVWQNTSATVKSKLPAGGHQFTMSADEIFVLRYEQWCRSCWDAVKDLGGYSVFIGKNNPVVVRAEAIPGVRANCVYWIDWLGVPMVCDIATGTSTPCVLPYGVCRGHCWYFYNDSVSGIDNNERKSGDDCEHGQNVEDLKSNAQPKC